MAALGPESAPTAIVAEKAEVQSTILPLESKRYPDINGHAAISKPETNGVVPTEADYRLKAVEEKLASTEERLIAAEARIKEMEAKIASLHVDSSIAGVKAAPETSAAPAVAQIPPTESITEKLAATLTFDVDEIKKRYTAERDKRLRADGNEQYKEFKGQFSHYLTDPYVPRQEREPLDIETDFLVLGGGFGGLSLAAELVKAGVSNFRIIDKAGDFGGTWYWNRYPGAACDIEAYIYMPLLEETNYIPTEKYAKAPELLEHSRRIGRHFQLYERAIFHTEAREMRWDEASTRWVITTDRGDKIRARYTASASGPLNMPKLPGVEGIERFRGHSFHTSRWDYEYTGGDLYGNLDKLANKRVGFIGTGATAIQAVPHLGAGVQKGESGKLFIFQRTPSSVSWRDNKPTDEAWAKGLKPGWQKERQENFLRVMGGSQEEDQVQDGWTRFSRWLKAQGLPRTPNVWREYGKLLELADMKNMDSIRQRCTDVVKDPSTAEALKPWYRQFCKRPCFHDEYLDTYNHSNVELVDTDGKGIDRITETGIVANGVEYPLDCIIYGTGFEVWTSYARRSNFEIYGRGGGSLTEKFSDGAKTLHGFWVNQFPNMFLISTLQSAYAANFVHALSRQAVHVAWLIKQCQDRGIIQIEATDAATEAWTDTIVKSAGFMNEFRKDCTPGYYNNEGKLEDSLIVKRFGNYGPGPMPFFKILEEWRTKGEFEGLELKDDKGIVDFKKEEKTSNVVNGVQSTNGETAATEVPVVAVAA